MVVAMVKMAGVILKVEPQGFADGRGVNQREESQGFQPE